MFAGSLGREHVEHHRAVIVHVSQDGVQRSGPIRSGLDPITGKLLHPHKALAIGAQQLHQSWLLEPRRSRLPHQLEEP